MYMYMDETGHSSNFVVTKPHSNTTMGKQGWRRGSGNYTYVHIHVHSGYYLSELKKEARQVNQKFFEF